jgi:hypothetical protein
MMEFKTNNVSTVATKQPRNILILKWDLKLGKRSTLPSWSNFFIFPENMKCTCAQIGLKALENPSSGPI